MEKIKESLQNELQRKNQLFAADHELVSQYESQIKHLTSLIKKSDMELMEQKRAYDHLVNERDVIGIQLIRRNDEIALLVEKIRVQQSALETGEIQYNERLNDIQILKTKIRDITREHNVTKNSGIKIAELKRNILNLERDLLQVSPWSYWDYFNVILLHYCQLYFNMYLLFTNSNCFDYL